MYPGKHTNLKNFLTRLDGIKEDCESSVATFKKKMEEDPHYAVCWSGNLFEATAKLKLITILNNIVDREIPDDVDLLWDMTEEQQNALFKKLGRVVLGYALASLSKSSSPTHNLGDLEFQQAAANLYRDWFMD